MPGQRSRHLIILAHAWAVTPFLPFVWMHPSPADKASPLDLQHLVAYWAAMVVYLAVRTVLAWRDPPRLRWDYVFPPIDAVVVSTGLYLRGDPRSSILFLYLFPIAEAASTLEFRWAGLIGTFCAALAAFAARPGMGADPVIFVFRVAMLVVMASLLTWLARLAADLHSRLRVAADRNRIALEMHDGVQGQLIAIASQLEVVRCVAPADGERAARLAAEARDAARRSADDLRFLVHRLRAPLAAEAFLPALQQYVHNLGDRTGVSISLSVDGGPRPLEPDVEHALFRIAQEALTNVLKHAGADRAEVRLEFRPDGVLCSIRDDGRGFDGAGVDADAHVGLGSMRERAHAIGGHLTVDSAPGAGTAVVVTVPSQRRAPGSRTRSGEKAPNHVPT